MCTWDIGCLGVFPGRAVNSTSFHIRRRCRDGRWIRRQRKSFWEVWWKAGPGLRNNWPLPSHPSSYLSFSSCFLTARLFCRLVELAVGPSLCLTEWPPPQEAGRNFCGTSACSIPSSETFSCLTPLRTLPPSQCPGLRPGALWPVTPRWRPLGTGSKLSWTSPGPHGGRRGNCPAN